VVHNASHITPMNDEYETCERTIAELRIYGDDLEPDFVTMHLGINPSRSQKRGEIRQSFGGGESQVKIGGWFLSSEQHVQSRDLRRHLDWLLAQLIPAKKEILALQEQKSIVMGVNCIWWSAFGDGGPTLWPEQMRLLADLNLECSFDISFFGESEDTDGKTRTIGKASGGRHRQLAVAERDRKYRIPDA